MLRQESYLKISSVFVSFVLVLYVVKIISTWEQQEETNKEAPSLSPSEKLFKLYDGVETFIMFIGYPRSSHSLVGAILDAHPEIIVPFEYDVIRYWEKYQSPRLRQKKMQKYLLFFDLHQLSAEQAMFGRYASHNTTLLEENEYTYYIPGLWQGGYDRRIKGIGDKKGGGTTMALTRSSINVLEEISQVVDVPIKFIHVIRNPFDNIATMMLQDTKSRDIVREEDVKVNNMTLLNEKIYEYFQMVDTNQHVRELYGDAVLDIPGHETVLRPRETLQRLCDHLGVTCSKDYFEKCSQILYENPSVTRNKVVWTEDQKQRVANIMKNYPFLKEYSFDQYPN